MKLAILFLIFSAFGGSKAFADPKEDFIKAAIDQCKIPKEKAESMATSGRTGTVVQYALCVNSAVNVDESCKVVCKKQGNNIGV